MRETALAERVARVVAAIPRGRVATYGQVAALAGAPGAARRVGAVLRALPADARVPWQRVVSAPGRVAPALMRGSAGARQARLLRREGVAVDASGRIDLRAHAWRPRLSVARRTP